MKRKTHAPLAAFAGLALATSAHGTLILYEGFDYSPGSVIGANGGTGFDGPWQDADIPDTRSDHWEVQSNGLEFSGLATVGGSIQRPGAPGGAAIFRTIDSGAQAALTADNTTIWFSFLTESFRFSVPNANGALLFSTGAITNMSDGGTEAQIAGGSAFGFTYQGLGNPNRMRLHGMTIADGNSSRSEDFIQDTEDTLYMIVGRIDWAPNGQDDVLRLYNVTDPEAGLPSSPFATMSADLDQSEFDTITIGSRQREIFDEIRFGTDLESVGVIPEPTTALLGSIGMLFLLRRRR